jgi:hypothetical protein
MKKQYPRLASDGDDADLLGTGAFEDARPPKQIHMRPCKPGKKDGIIYPQKEYGVRFFQ